MDETLLFDIKEALQSVSSHHIPQWKWIKNHIFYGNGVTLGVKGQNRGRAPFVRYYVGGRNWETQTVGEVGGSYNTDIIVEIVTASKRVTSQETNIDEAYGIWRDFLDELNKKENYMESSKRVEELQVSPVMFMLRGIITVRNSWGG